ncbi:hypothetical protein VNO77_29810 [Canavalia gladiata]|uniref:Uncharacterized protein n=1 Tax=Canavalia gladiata TaxID=3824 RepID=A0AAN9Q397_CANGL
MSEQNPNDNHEDSRNVSSRCFKRGRPRKYPNPDGKGSSYLLLNERRNQNIGGGGNDALVPPGFEPIVGNKKCQRDQVNGLNDVKVGQIVSAEIDGEFEGGFWVSVRDGNSDSIFKGQIFKPKSPHVINQTTHSLEKGKEVLHSLKPSFLQRGKNISKDAKQDSVFGSETKASPTLPITGTSEGRGKSLRRNLSREGNQVALPPTHQTSENILHYLSSNIVVDETVSEIIKNPMMAFDFENLVNEVVKKVTSCSGSLSHMIDNSDQPPEQQ